MAEPNYILTDKFPAEVRLRIFKHALRCESPVANAYQRKQINTSLFLVNKLISKEAKDAFYEVNTIRLHDPYQLNAVVCGGEDLKALVRSVELTNHNKPVWYSSKDNTIMKTLKELSSAPKIQTITVSCDEINYTTRETTREWIEKIVGNRKAACKITCVDIGHFEVEFKNMVRLHFKHLRLIQQWDFAKKRFSQQGVNEAIKATFVLSQESFTNAVTLAKFNMEARTDLHRWAILHWNAELFANKLVPAPGNDLAGLSQFIPFTIRETSARFFPENILVKKKGGSKLRVFKQSANMKAIAELGPHSDGETLEWATDLLVSNVALEERKQEEIRKYVRQLGA